MHYTLAAYRFPYHLALIANYRTSKARVDEQYYKTLMTEAKHEYEKARQRYGSYADANTDVQLASLQ